MREVILDTETTGLDPAAGHRIVEIAGLELINHLPTGRTYQQYLNPERDMPADSFAIHGLSAEFLADKPLFGDIVDQFLGFIADSQLIIHNAEFDLKFLNAELAKAERPGLPPERATDTVLIARQKFPGSPASLDALCRRFAIDNSARAKHGALLDTELLAEVYLELIGGRQAGLELVSGRRKAPELTVVQRQIRPPRPHAPTEAELAAHAALLTRLKNPVWPQ
ncbi:MAG: DNA polymerase III subunit epsilon [Dongiaceae bacterium]